MSRPLIPIGADHRGFALKSRLVAWLDGNGYEVRDLGAHSAERCDAMDFATQMAAEFQLGGVQFGVLICGTGQAMAMTANRYRRLRAALCVSVDMAKAAREHNDANVLAIGADLMTPDEAQAILETFLTTSFLGGRYAERRDKVTALGGL